MDTKYRVSIIIPIYNQEKYLEECLDSVLNQDLEEYQVILIDDGSTDKSGEICRQYVRNYHGFRYLYQENSGLGSARNTGIRYAEGRYLLFVDSDDAIAANCLGTLTDYMAERNLDILYVDEMICDDRLRFKNICPTYPFMQTQIIKEQALEYCMQPAHICSRIYNRRLFLDIRFENIWYEDMFCFPELISRAERIGYFKAPVYYYRQHQGAITNREKDVRNLDVIKAWNKSLNLPSLSERERDAVVKAVMKSVSTFVFFKMKYASEYISWYQEVLENRVAIREEYGRIEAAEPEDDYPLLQQAKIQQDRTLADRIEILKKLYAEGGVYYFMEYGGSRNVSETEHLSFIQNGKLELYSIKIQPRSKVLYHADRELRKQNLISRNGEIREFVLEKVLMQAFMEFGYPVRLL